MEKKIIVTAPKEQPFYKYMAIAFSYMGLGFHTWWGFEFPKKINIFLFFHHHVSAVFAPICFVSQIIFLCMNYSELSFEILGSIFSIVPVSFLAVVKVLSAQTQSYKKVVTNFMNKIHVYNYYCKDKQEFVKQKVIQVERLTRWTLYCLMAILIIDWAMWMIIPIMNNIENAASIQNKTMRLETCLYMVVPFDYKYDYSNWLILHLINVYTSFVGVLMIIVFDTWNFSYVFHLIGHIQILKHNIATEITSDNKDQNEVKKRLVKIIEYHSFIIETFNDIEAAFGVNVAGNYAQNLFEDSFLLYQIMFVEKQSMRLMYALMVIVYMGGLVLISLVLEEIKKQTDDLPSVVYDMPWEEMSISNQKIVLLLLARVQIPLEFKAAGGMKAGVRPALSIIKSTFSYYVMLKSSM